MLRIAFQVYILVSLAMVATSFYTGHRATAMTGREHYLLTHLTLDVDEEVAADNSGDAAFDAALRDAGETTMLPVTKPIFVLGFADATGPVVLAGGLFLSAAWGISLARRRRRDSSQGHSRPIS